MLKNIKIEELYAHPQNPRKNIGDVAELANSIGESGIFQNLTVVVGGAGVPEGKDGYTVIIGHRRLAASKQAGLTELPCAVVEMSEKEQIATMLLENMQRSDLTLVEQAQGFQMMLDLGDTHEEIAQKTGFSVTTVKKRLKIATLDPDALNKRENDAQITMADYIKIAEIEDKKEQKNLIAAAGTKEFNWRYKNAFEAQQRKKLRPLIEKELKGICKKGKGDDHWSNKFEYVERIRIEDYKPGVFEKAAKKLAPEVLARCVWEISTYDVYFLKPREKKTVEKPKKSKAEIEADKLRNQLQKLHEKAFQLRYDFIMQFTASKKYQDVIYEYLLVALIHRHSSNWSPTFNAKIVNDITGANEGKYNINEAKTLELLKNEPSKVPALLTWCALGDNKDNYCYDGSWGVNKPKYKDNRHLRLAYAFLEALGYQISTEEQQMLDGTHPAYNGGAE